jgi:hypothetical protein
MKNARCFAQLRFVIRSVAVASMLLAFPSPCLAQLKVLISGGFSSA